MILNAATQSLQVVLEAAHVSLPLQIVGGYVLHSATDAVPTPILTQTNGTTAVTLMPGPAANQQHQLASLSVFNADTGSQFVVIRVNDNGTFRPLSRTRLLRNESLVYELKSGWQVRTAEGAIKTVDLVREEVPEAVSVVSPLPLLLRASISNAVAGSEMSLWRGTGYPAQGAVPAAAAACNAATVGAYPLAARSGGQRRVLRGLWVSGANTSQGVYVEDRLAHMGGLSGTVTTAQTAGLDLSTILGTNNLAERIGAANYSEVQWFLEWYTATGATPVTPTVNVTYDDGSTGNAIINVLGANGPLPATVAASRRYEILPAVQGRYIRHVNTITHVTTGTAGSYGVTAVRRLATVVTPAIATRPELVRFPRASAPVIPDNSCLTLAMLSTTTTTGLVQGQIEQEVYAA